ncbi:MAG: methyl-accepting chemotaxis protein [Clostridiales bacterium]|nr:methyl-accepting chemotaxis protein [Clostridiales bacterium]
MNNLVKKPPLKRIREHLHSIRTKIIIMLILISIIPVLFIGIIFALQSENILKRKLEATSTQTIQEVGRGLDNYFGAMSNMVNILSKDSNIIAADTPESFEFAKGLIANVYDTDDAVLNVFVGTDKGLFYMHPEVELTDFDHKSRQWYKNSIAQPGKVIFSNPYEDFGTGDTVISLTSAIVDKDKVIGVAGVDISLDTLADQLKDIVVGDTGYIYIADQNGAIITHPKLDYIGDNVGKLNSSWSEISRNKEGFTAYEHEGEKLFGSYMTSDLTNWKIIAAMNLTELTKDMSTVKNTLVLLTILIVIIAIIASALFTRPIYNNMKALVDGFNKVDTGDLTAKVTIKSKDEFSMLADQFNEMVENMSRIIKNVGISSTNVLDSAIELANMAEETNASTIEVSRAVEEVAHGAAEQAEYSAEGASSVTDLSERLNQIEDETNSIELLTQDTNQLISQGLGRVKELIQKSNYTEASTEQVSGFVLEMSQSMERITAISNTIDMITEQTNLLSLNASIEAARSGEAGRGFAVVANEIRKLAEQSKASTVEINDTIEEIQQKTDLSVKAMNQTKDTVKEQAAVVDQTQKVFQEIMNAVSNLTTSVAEIKNYAQDIAQKKDHIVEQIENVSAVSEETASASEEVTASTEQIAATMDEISKYATNLNNLAEELKGKVNQFKTMD